MAKEIERKFLVSGEAWREGARGLRITQGYLSLAKERTVRVRVAGDEAWLTVKGLTTGCERLEFEYPIPAADARAMLASLAEGPVLDKVRYRVEHAGRAWEIDEFLGDNAGLVVAEIELPAADAPFEKPGWAGAEVSDDPRYFNACLITNPYCRWGR
ncbi:MAG: CYTH domain-containing protein [Duodenibacillus sp.]|nr:CYTH domain-containing protein [Duodenibacillus sp.]